MGDESIGCARRAVAMNAVIRWIGSRCLLVDGAMCCKFVVVDMESFCVVRADCSQWSVCQSIKMKDFCDVIQLDCFEKHASFERFNLGIVDVGVG